MKTQILSSVIALAFFGCSTTQQNGAASFANSPAGQAIIKTAVTGLMVGAMSAATQYGATGSVNGQAIATAELPVLLGSQQSMLALVGTPQADNSNAIVTAVTQGGGNSAIAKKVAPIALSNVKTMIDKGIVPDVAVQKAAAAIGAVPKAAVAVQKGASQNVVVAAAAKAIAAK